MQHLKTLSSGIHYCKKIILHCDRWRVDSAMESESEESSVGSVSWDKITAHHQWIRTRCTVSKTLKNLCMHHLLTLCSLLLYKFIYYFTNTNLPSGSNSLSIPKCSCATRNACSSLALGCFLAMFWKSNNCDIQWWINALNANPSDHDVVKFFTSTPG